MLGEEPIIGPSSIYCSMRANDANSVLSLLQLQNLKKYIVKNRTFTFTNFSSCIMHPVAKISIKKQIIGSLYVILFVIMNGVYNMQVDLNNLLVTFYLVH